MGVSDYYQLNDVITPMHDLIGDLNPLNHKGLCTIHLCISFLLLLLCLSGIVFFFFLACYNLADGEVQGVSMPTGGSCASRATAECVADAVASPRDWKTLINDLLTQVNVLVLGKAGSRSV